MYRGVELPQRLVVRVNRILIHGQTIPNLHGKRTADRIRQTMYARVFHRETNGKCFREATL